MSTGIHKSIGAFIRLENASQLLVPNVSVLVDQHCEEPESLANDFLPYFEQEIQSLTLDAGSIACARHQAKQIATRASAYGSAPMVREIHFYDSAVGFLLRNVQNLKYCRVNDDIDYLENCTCMQNTIAPAAVPIHAAGGQQYIGPPDPELTRLLDGGVRLTRENQFFVFSVLANRASREYCPFTEAHRCIVDSGLFAPETDPLVYIIARKLRLLKEGFTLKEFERVARPSILTYWS